MFRRQHQISSRYGGTDPNHDDLVLRIRRLVQHKAYDRTQIGSALLKRFAPHRIHFGQSFPEADLRRRLEEASLDAKALSYLTMSAEAELELARQRLLELSMGGA